MSNTKKIYKKIVCLLTAVVLLVGGIVGKNIYDIMADTSFEQTLKSFPESYRPYIQALHDKHPNWTFEAFNTGLDWNEVLKNESALSRKLVPAAGHSMSLGLADLKSNGEWAWYQTPTAWKAYDDVAGAYNYSANNWVSFDTGYWNQASTSAISYIMDPRNWLNESYIYMFEKLSYDGNHDTVELVNSTLNGTFMYNAKCPGAPNNMTYAQVIVEAAKKSKVSAIHLAVRLRQEKGTSNDELGKGVSTKDGSNFYQANGDGNTVYYNFFNIGAAGSGKQTVINNGGKEAKAAGWTSPYLAIMGGAVKVYTGYIGIGQDTIYFEMFSVVNPKYYYWKQYAQNLTATLTEGSKIYETYKNAGLLNSSFVFRIPVYKNMPSSCKKPASPSGDERTTANPNTRLSGISATLIDMDGKSGNANLTPSFNSAITEYSLVVPYKVSQIKLSASAYAKTSSISGTGTHSLKVGNNEFNIVCKSEYGTTKTYKVKVTRAEGSTYLTSLSSSKSGFNETFNMNTYKYTMRVANDVTSLALNYKTESSIAIVEMRTGSTTTVLSNGTTGNINLPVGTTKVYIDIYPSASDRSERKTYEVDITRLTKVSVDFKELILKDQYIHNFAVGDTVNTALQRLKVTGGTAQITDSSGNVKSGDKIIGTGDMLRIHDSNGSLYMSKNIVIYGDVNGDGKIDMFDAAYLKKHVWINPFLTGIKLEAANVYEKSEGIDIMDMAVIKKCMWYGGTINQKRD
ncbi:cadherin-like beta sandwich domain-containing protein [Eshraghiella crossota]